MRKLLFNLPPVLALLAGLASCHDSPKTEAAAPGPSGAQQAVSPQVANLYMAVGAAPRYSRRQQDLLRQMATDASNGKELLMVMRAEAGVFRSEQNAEDQLAEHRIRSTVAAKMMQVAALEQLTEYAMRYPVNPEDARPLAQRMLDLAGSSSDPRVWYQIVRAAKAMRVHDLAQQAQTKGDLVAGR